MGTTGAATELTDHELEQVALAAEAHDPFADDVEPFSDPDSTGEAGLLPEWYMPAPSNRLGFGRRLGLTALAIGMLLINVGGFCTTYGFPEFVWH